jgi:hypothetical protein
MQSVRYSLGVEITGPSWPVKRKSGCIDLSFVNESIMSSLLSPGKSSKEMQSPIKKCIFESISTDITMLPGVCPGAW